MATILIVEDDEHLLDLYTELLSDEFQVLTASSVAEATGLLANQEINAVGCDYRLRDGFGLEVVAWISAHKPDLLHTTAIISGEPSPPLRGFNIKCLYKPVPLDELLNLFCTWLPPCEGISNHVTHSA